MSETMQAFEERMKVWQATGRLPEAEARRPTSGLEIDPELCAAIARSIDGERGNVREESDPSLDRLFGDGRNRFFESTEEVRAPGDYLFGDGGYGHLFGDA